MEMETRIEFYSIAIAAVGFIYGMFRNLRGDLNEKTALLRGDLEEFKRDTKNEFQKVHHRIDTLVIQMGDDFYMVSSMIDSVKTDIIEVKERLSFLEAANIYTMPLEPSEPNPRSSAAREMWRRRRQRKIEKKDE